MKNIYLLIIALATVLFFTSCEQNDIVISQETEFLDIASQLKTQDIELAKSYNLKPPVSDNLQSDLENRSPRKMMNGVSFIVNGELEYNIPECTFTVTENGAISTYIITAIDRFEETTETATYTFEFDVDNTTSEHIPRVFSYAWPMFSAWPVPELYFFGTWSADYVSETVNQVVFEVPVEDPFVISKFDIAMDNSGFTTSEFEGVIRIIAEK